MIHHIVKKQFRHAEEGMALVAVLMFMSIALVIFTGAITVVAINIQGHESYSEGNAAYYIAESGADIGIQRLLRNPYYAGETLTIGTGSATIVVTRTLNSDNTLPNSFTLKSTGTAYPTSSGAKQYNSTVDVQVSLYYYNNVFTILNWEQL